MNSEHDTTLDATPGSPDDPNTEITAGSAATAPSEAQNGDGDASTQNGSKKKKYIILGILAVLIGAGAYSGFRFYQYASTHASTDNAHIEGHVASASPHVGGYVDEVLVDDNEIVEKGQVLVRINADDLDLKVQHATDALQSAKAAVQSAKASIKTAQAQRATARAGVQAAKVQFEHAKREYHRQKNLIVGHATTQRAVDNASSALAGAKAKLSVSRRQVAVAEAGIGSAKSALSQAKSNVSSAKTAISQAENMRSYAEVRAPIDGRVVKKSVEPGQLVQPGQPLMAVVQDTTTWIRANYKEKHIARIKVGQTATLDVDAYKDHPFEGRVQSIAGATGSALALLPPDDATGNFVKVQRWIPVKIIVTNPDPEYPLRPGMNVTVHVDTTSEGEPEDALPSETRATQPISRTEGSLEARANEGSGDDAQPQTIAHSEPADTASDHKTPTPHQPAH